MIRKSRAGKPHPSHHQHKLMRNELSAASKRADSSNPVTRRGAEGRPGKKSTTAHRINSRGRPPESPSLSGDSHEGALLNVLLSRDICTKWYVSNISPSGDMVPPRLRIAIGENGQNHSEQQLGLGTNVGFILSWSCFQPLLCFVNRLAKESPKRNSIFP